MFMLIFKDERFDRLVFIALQLSGGYLCAAFFLVFVGMCGEINAAFSQNANGWG
jgi:hypothetical protein